jgi:hypothetical protein
MNGAQPKTRGRWLAALAAGAAALTIAACGGGGGGGGDAGSALRSEAQGVASTAAPAIAGTNVVAIRVDTGTNGNAINSPFVTVTVCQPGTANCVDIDRVVVDTGSSGLRIAASAVPAGVALPRETVGANNVWQCMQFASGYSWGSVRRADVRLGGEAAANLPVQVVNDAAITGPNVPASCRARGFDIGSGLGANGILGVGFLTQDCGAGCVASGAPNVYFACTGGGACATTALPLASQVANPVSSFAVNNNGVAVVLPAVPEGGAGVATGWLVFGIGTQANNALGGAAVYTTDAQGFFTTTYKGVAYPRSFIDSGSNGLFFNDGSFPTCGDFYCPGGTVALSAVNTGLNGLSGTVDFTVEDVTAIRTDAAAAHIAGTTGIAASFDWGLPFFFGRTVFVARSGAMTPAGMGPYWAY